MMGKTSWRVRAMILAVAFLVSSLLFFVLVISLNLPMATGGPTPPPDTSWTAIFGVVATALTSLTTLAGLVLTIQKDRRESRKSDLEARRIELELERADLELETLRKERAG